MKKNQESTGLRKKLEEYSYLLNQNIGKGYSSQVFRGRNDVTDQPVAIKVIDMKKINNDVHKNLLSSEMEVLKSLKNMSNILDLFDIYNTKNNTYIITELCDGDLSKHIAGKKCLAEPDAVSLMNQVINGYNNIQSRGIIHRDLKPANIFLKNSSIKIADFGFAMKHSDSKKYSSYNVGSPVYMPPQALNENKYSFKSDIWALGVIYYEMLTGKTPWRAKTEKELARLLISVPIKKLLPPSISHSSETFLLRTLAVDINERMTPDEMQRYVLSCDKVSLNRQVYSTQNSIFDGKNNNIRRDRQEVSLNKNSIPNQNNFKKISSLQQTQQDFKVNKLNLPKTAATVNNKTQHFIQNNSNKIIYEPFTHKQISAQPAISDQYDRKYLSKQLLSQIHFCRFVYKLIMRMSDTLNDQRNNQLTTLKGYLCGTIFGRLNDVEELKVINTTYAADFKQSSDFTKINQIINQYSLKYQKDLAHLTPIKQPLQQLKQQLTKNIILLYKHVEQDHQDMAQWKDEVIVLDYLVTLRQLIGIAQNNDLQGFHSKSKIEAIVEGSPSKVITEQHLLAIKSKLKAIKII